jgi:2-keto-4-pentenoate hydratase
MRVAEPEFAFRFRIDLAPRPAPYTVDEVLAAVDSLHPALEVPNSRFVDFARAGEAQLLADDACAHRFVLGLATAADWRAIELRSHRVAAQVVGTNGRRWSRDGDGTAVLGDPRTALTWLVNELRGLGLILEAGQFVTTGTCMKPLEIEPGDAVTADFGVLGAVSLRAVD